MSKSSCSKGKFKRAKLTKWTIQARQRPIRRELVQIPGMTLISLAASPLDLATTLSLSDRPPHLHLLRDVSLKLTSVQATIVQILYPTQLPNPSVTPHSSSTSLGVLRNSRQWVHPYSRTRTLGSFQSEIRGKVHKILLNARPNIMRSWH